MAFSELGSKSSRLPLQEESMYQRFGQVEGRTTATTLRPTPSQYYEQSFFQPPPSNAPSQFPPEWEDIYQRSPDEVSLDNIIAHYRNSTLLYPNDAFIGSVINNDPELLLWAIQGGAEVQMDNNLALMLASKLGYLRIVKILYQYGANINSRNLLALRLAQKYNHRDVVEFLSNHSSQQAGLNAEEREARNNSIQFWDKYKQAIQSNNPFQLVGLLTYLNRVTKINLPPSFKINDVMFALENNRHSPYLPRPMSPQQKRTMYAILNRLREIGQVYTPPVSARF